MGELIGLNIAVQEPDDDDAAGWKKVAEERAEQLNDMGDQLAVQWSIQEDVRELLQFADHTRGQEPLSQTAAIAAEIYAATANESAAQSALITRLRAVNHSLRVAVEELTPHEEEDEDG